MMTGFEFVILVFSIYVLAEIIRRIAAHRAIAKEKRAKEGQTEDQHRALDPMDRPRGQANRHDLHL